MSWSKAGRFSSVCLELKMRPLGSTRPNIWIPKWRSAVTPLLFPPCPFHNDTLEAWASSHPTLTPPAFPPACPLPCPQSACTQQMSIRALLGVMGSAGFILLGPARCPRSCCFGYSEPPLQKKYQCFTPKPCCVVPTPSHGSRNL